MKVNITERQKVHERPEREGPEYQFDGMSKLQLRSVCRDYKVKGYSKMNNEQMRAALADAVTTTGSGEKLAAANTEAATAPPKKTRKAAPAADDVKRPKAGGKCD